VSGESCTSKVGCTRSGRGLTTFESAEAADTADPSTHCPPLFRVAPRSSLSPSFSFSLPLRCSVAPPRTLCFLLILRVHSTLPSFAAGSLCFFPFCVPPGLCLGCGTSRRERAFSSYWILGQWTLWARRQAKDKKKKGVAQPCYPPIRRNGKTTHTLVKAHQVPGLAFLLAGPRLGHLLWILLGPPETFRQVPGMHLSPLRPSLHPC
jgi:hypothetical protein